MQVQAVWKKNYQVEVKARQFQIPIDEAPEFHGDDTGMMPTELFLCSLASCFCLALVYAGRKKRIEIKDMSVNVKAEKDLKNFLFSRIVVEVETSLLPEDVELIMPLAKKYCFISNTIAKPCPVEYVVK